MNLAVYQLETNRITAHTRRSTGLSLLIHVLALAWLIAYQQSLPENSLVTEITWIEPETLKPEPSKIVPEPPKERIVPETRQPEPREQRFEREPDPAQVEPKPQSKVISDRLRAKLDQAPDARVTRALQAASAAPGQSILDRAVPSAPSIPQQGNTTLELKRDDRPATPALELKRSAPSVQQSRLADVAAPPVDPRRAVESAAESSGPALGANSMSGPAADRPLLSRVLPRYPDWAKREGVEASVSLYFIVLPDGSVKPNVLVQKTSGFDDFDREARRALLAWRFEALSGGDAAEQWGTITFNFRLTTLR